MGRKTNGYVGFMGFCDEYTHFERKYYPGISRKNSESKVNAYYGDSILFSIDDSIELKSLYLRKEKSGELIKKCIGRHEGEHFLYKGKYIKIEMINKNYKHLGEYGDVLRCQKLRDNSVFELSLTNECDSKYEPIVLKCMNKSAGYCFEVEKEYYKILEIIPKENKEKIHFGDIVTVRKDSKNKVLKILPTDIENMDFPVSDLECEYRLINNGCYNAKLGDEVEGYIITSVKSLNSKQEKGIEIEREKIKQEEYVEKSQKYKSCELYSIQKKNQHEIEEKRKEKYKNNGVSI